MGQMDTDQDKSRTLNPHLRPSAPSADTPEPREGAWCGGRCRRRPSAGIAFARYNLALDREQDIPFVYENGVLRPEGPVDFPEGARGIAHIREISGASTGFRANPTIEQLRKQQGTLPLRRPEDLAGDWPAEDSLDEFLDSVRRGRR